MRFYSIILLIVCGNPSVYADVVGKWKLDAEKTIVFNKENGKSSDLWMALLNCLAQHSTLEINSDRYIYSVKDHKCSHGGKSAVIEGYEVNYPYKIIMENINVTAMAIESEEGYESLGVIYKLKDDFIWIYYPGEPENYDSHIRHYYKRQK